MRAAWGSVSISTKLEWIAKMAKSMPGAAYFEARGHFRARELLYEGTKRIWHKWLGRRSNRPLLWERMAVILKVFLLAS